MLLSLGKYMLLNLGKYIIGLMYRRTLFNFFVYLTVVIDMITLKKN